MCIHTNIRICKIYACIIGAGDDEENWCMGMNSDLFWANKDEILSSDDPKEVHTSKYIHVYARI
jgi:hypothetical protein